MDIFGIVIIGVSAIFFIIFIIAIFIDMSPKKMEKRLIENMSIMTRAENKALKENEKILRENANMTADINKDAVKTITHAVKEGFAVDDTIYCKYCGRLIDKNSKFCKYFGKEQEKIGFNFIESYFLDIKLLRLFTKVSINF